jgi:hypothetical protein
MAPWYRAEEGVCPNRARPPINIVKNGWVCPVTRGATTKTGAVERVYMGMVVNPPAVVTRGGWQKGCVWALPRGNGGYLPYREPE